MLRLLLARHGETKWNLEGRYQGQVDTELSDLGQTQGEKLGESLRVMPIDAVLASPLRRARETAEYCAKWHGLPVVADADLTEIAHGAWEGKLVAEVAHADGDRLTAWRTKPQTVTMPQGESLHDVARRVERALARYRTQYDGKTLLAVAHDAVNKVALCRILGLDLSHFWQIQQDNGCVNVLTYDGGWRVLAVNVNTHLGCLYSQTEQKSL